MLPSVPFLVLLLCLFTLSAAQKSVQIDDYLSSLSTDDLEKICRDRGFEIDEAATREDYIEAARRCISLEDEINAILNENPELAAEIDAEILRLEKQRDQLQQEREAILREKALLEQQLRYAGVDIKDFLNETKKEEPTPPAQPQQSAFQKRMAEARPTTAVETIKESLILLYLRVREDFLFIWKLISPVVLPLWASIRRVVGLVHRYTLPPRQPAEPQQQP